MYSFLGFNKHLRDFNFLKTKPSPDLNFKVSLTQVGLFLEVLFCPNSSFLGLKLKL